MAVQFVYFDLGNVLLRFDNQRACQQIARQSGLPIETVCNFFEGSDYANRLEAGSVTPEEVHDAFCRELGCQCSLAELKLAGSDMFDVNHAIVPLVTRLAVAGIPLGILSNTSAPHWEFVSDGRFRFLNELFRCYALSFQLGAMKPDIAIYQAAARLADCHPQSIFFTDDRPENVAAARTAGWNAVPFESVHQLAGALRDSGLRFWF